MIRYQLSEVKFDDKGIKDYGVEFIFNEETDSCFIGFQVIDAVEEEIKKENMSLREQIEFRNVLSKDINAITNVFKKAKRNDAWDYDTFLDKNNIARKYVYSVFVTHMILEDMISKVSAEGVC